MRKSPAQRAVFVNKTYRKSGHERLHRVRAEAALGHSLPPDAVVHHADGTKSDKSVLVICENRDYHNLLHKRMRILRAGGNPNTDAWCSRCQGPRPISEFYVRRTGRDAGSLTSYCWTCQRILDAVR